MQSVLKVSVPVCFARQTVSVFLHKFLAPSFLIEGRNEHKLYQTERIGTFYFRSRRGEGG